MMGKRGVSGRVIEPISSDFINFYEERGGLSKCEEHFRAEAGMAEGVADESTPPRTFTYGDVYNGEEAIHCNKCLC